MERIVFSIYDIQADYYDKPIIFDDEKLAIATMRRDIRDMYIRKEVTYDALRDRQIRCVGVFDSSTGQFTNSDLEDININLSSFVGDLVSSDEV